MGAICEDCRLDTMVAEGCLPGQILIDCNWYRRQTETVFDGFPDTERCHDCGVEPGHFHHWHCDAELCPKCGGQLISCGCKVTEKRFRNHSDEKA